MWVKVLTIFPEMLRPMLQESILGRAEKKGLLRTDLIDIRPFSDNKHKNTDDYPFGGGAGMVMMAQPIVDAVEAQESEGFTGRRIYLSPRGRTFTQKVAEELAKEEQLLLLCGHYEGVDQRALDLCGFEEISIGDYVLTGGELGALVIIDAVSRLVPGVLGSEESSVDESFSSGLLEYPQYTRPREYRGLSVPDVLLNGNHKLIVDWRLEQSLAITRRNRPDLLTPELLASLEPPKKRKKSHRHHQKEESNLFRNLAGTRTEANLQTAYAGESQAYSKYTYFASRAEKDGYAQLASLFLETADNEKEHARIWFKLLNGIGSTEENLLHAAQGENFEWTDMYAAFAREAREEGFDDIAALFEGVATIEKEHKERFCRLLANLKDDIVFSREGDTLWECRNCGYIVTGQQAPEKCPVCSHPRSYFEVRAENY